MATKNKQLKEDLLLIGEPSLTLGVSDFNATSSTRPFVLKDFKDTSRENMLAAAKEFIAQHKNNGYDGIPVHPDFTQYKDLPLSSVRVFPFGNHVVGAGLYRRSRTTPNRYPAFEFCTEQSYEAGRRTRRYFPEEKYKWTRDGNNLGQTWSLEYRWEKYDYRHYQIIASTVLDEHPQIAILKTLNKTSMDGVYQSINATPFFLNGVLRPAGSLRFEDMAIQPIDTFAGRKWFVMYEYTLDPLTFFHRYLHWAHATCSDLVPVPTTSEGCTLAASRVGIYQEILVDKEMVFKHTPDGSLFSLTTKITPLYQQVEFNNLFPTHDQAKGWLGLIKPTKPSSGGSPGSSPRFRP